MPLTREITVADGVTLALDDWSEHAEGGADARPVLFLHATGFTRGVWRTHARRLLSDCVPYAADLRGAGGSSRPEPPYLWSLIVEDIVTLVGGRGVVGPGDGRPRPWAAPRAWRWRSGCPTWSRRWC